MGLLFDQVLLRVAPADAAPVRAAVADRAWIVAGGPGGIGWHSDELAVLLPADPARPVDASALVGGRCDVQSVRRLESTARPTAPDRPSIGAGVLALRSFELAAADWDEFLELSVTAWPGFEASYDAQILGLFRSVDTAAPDAAALLVTWYASLASWEQSRGTVRATDGVQADAGRKFLRRHQLTRRTIVRVSPTPATA